MNAYMEYADGRGYLNIELAVLEALPTLSEAHTADLKIESDDKTERVWLERVGRDSGMPYDNMVTVEFLLNGKWVTIAEYEAT